MIPSHYILTKHRNSEYPHNVGFAESEHPACLRFGEDWKVGGSTISRKSASCEKKKSLSCQLVANGNLLSCNLVWTFFIILFHISIRLALACFEAATESMLKNNRKCYTMKRPAIWFWSHLPFCSKQQDPKVQPRVTLLYYLNLRSTDSCHWLQQALKQQATKWFLIKSLELLQQNIKVWYSGCPILNTCVLLYRTHIGQERYWKQSTLQSAHAKFEFVFISVADIYVLKSVKFCGLVRARVRVVCVRSAWRGSRIGGVESTSRIWLTRPVLSDFVCGSAIATSPYH